MRGVQPLPTEHLTPKAPGRDRILIAEDVDFAVLDVDMPGLDGLAVGRALRSDPKTRGWPIAMHTSRSEHDVRSGFRDYDVFLPKPCEHRALGDAIERLVQGKRFA